MFLSEELLSSFFFPLFCNNLIAKGDKNKQNFIFRSIFLDMLNI